MASLSTIFSFPSLLILAFLEIPILVLSASCINPSEPFPVPRLEHSSDDIKSLFSELEESIVKALDTGKAPWNTTVTSFALEVTSADDTLWQAYHTAPLLGDYPDSKTIEVDGTKAFRIASISKVFTVLAILLLQQDGKLSIKDSVVKYIPELAEGKNEGGIEWGSISLESLASQLSGIPRECMPRSCKH